MRGSIARRIRRAAPLLVWEQPPAAVPTQAIPFMGGVQFLPLAESRKSGRDKSFAGMNHETSFSDVRRCLDFLNGAVASFAQQADTPKPATPKKPAAAQSSEKPAESATKPETPAEPKPAPREASADKREKDKEEHYDMTEVAAGRDASPDHRRRESC